MAKPFLLRYAKQCISPKREPINPNYEYDDDIDMVRWLGSPDKPPVIEIFDSEMTNGPKDQPPTTKKADIEKGDDQKDFRMWKRH